MFPPFMGEGHRLKELQIALSLLRAHRRVYDCVCLWEDMELLISRSLVTRGSVHGIWRVLSVSQQQQQTRIVLLSGEKLWFAAVRKRFERSAPSYMRAGRLQPQQQQQQQDTLLSQKKQRPAQQVLLSASGSSPES